MCDTVFSCASKLNLIVFLQRWLFQGPKKHFFSEQKQKTHQRRKKNHPTPGDVDFNTWLSEARKPPPTRSIWHPELKFGDVQKDWWTFQVADIKRKILGICLFLGGELLITFILHLGRFPNFSYISFTTFFSDELKWLALKYAKVTPNIEVS